MHAALILVRPPAKTHRHATQAVFSTIGSFGEFIEMASLQYEEIEAQRSAHIRLDIEDLYERFIGEGGTSSLVSACTRLEAIGIEEAVIEEADVVFKNNVVEGGPCIEEYERFVSCIRHGIRYFIDGGNGEAAALAEPVAVVEHAMEGGAAGEESGVAAGATAAMDVDGRGGGPDELAANQI